MAKCELCNKNTKNDSHFLDDLIVCKECWEEERFKDMEDLK